MIIVQTEYLKDFIFKSNFIGLINFLSIIMILLLCLKS
jgi:hypothetical protein